jgi:DNA-binding MarR family transcriptional regulator
MRISTIMIICALCAALVLLPAFYNVHAQNLVQYKVQVSSEGSAVWTITQASDVNGTIDTWQGFQQRVADLIHTASIQTQREMSLNNNSLQLSTIWETQSHTTEYEFTWLNFSIIQYGKIIFGDVFQVRNFFSQLYGDGEIQIVYPSTYQLQSVTPQPNGGDTGPQTLDWLGAQFFADQNPTIALTESAPSPTPDQNTNSVDWPPYAVGLGLALAIGATLSVFYFRRRKTKITQRAQIIANLPIIESEEEKIVKAIRANGGTAYQSAITEACRFSKAKTSQLLTALEKKGIVTRYKKGRDKIVSLTEKGKGETP